MLWDIDHTLIETRGVGRAINERVFPAVTGKPLRQLAKVAGRTELAILSGNLRDVSRIKLEVFGLDAYLDLASSAYGDDHTERSTLVTIAQQRATKRMMARFDNRHTVLIGDTPKDVEAALTAGVQVIAVASGKSNETDLAQAGAPVTVSDLTHTKMIVQSVTDGDASAEKPHAGYRASVGDPLPSSPETDK